MRILVLLLAVCLCACNQSELKKILSGSDSLVINFSAPGSDTIIKTVSTTEKNAIRQLTDFADGKTIEQLKCGYDGNLVFYSKGEMILPVLFKYKKEDCRYFLFELGGKGMSTRLSNEAADFLQSLETGRSFY